VSTNEPPAPAPAAAEPAAPAPAAPAAALVESERRAYERRPLRISAVLKLPSQKPLTVRTFDISPSGMSVIAPINPRPGIVGELVMQFPVKPGASVPFESAVQIIHSVFSSSESDFRIGLRFISLPAELSAFIQQFLTKP
jgi:c-di-GMP-binding flagellar brake protein YcgR